MNNLLIDFNSTEKDKLSRILRRLLSETFIVRNKNKNAKESKDREDYNYIRNNEDLINDCLEPLGYTVKVDTKMEVAMLALKFDTDENIYSNRLQIGQQKSLFVFILFQYYLSKKRELNESVVMNNEELDSELKVFNINMSKKEILEIISVLRKHNIVEKNSRNDITEPNGEIIIYPSIYFTIDISAAEIKYQQIKDAVETRNTDDEEEEEINEE